nr:putative ribonuclease H-like domain-containing protein [Tanacetum cinerariifolium]
VEAVNTACYVQNRVLVTKPHNKTPYELLHGRLPSIGFMRPFGCPVTIFNTLDPLGKFQGKVDEGFLVRYSVCSKAFRVFNSRTNIVQETLHVNFMENKPNVAGSGPVWLFDIDSLTRTINYHPVIAENQNALVDGKEHDDDIQKSVSSDIHSSSSGAQKRKQEFEECTNNSSNGVNAASSSVSTVGHNFINSTNDFSVAGPLNVAASPTTANSSSQDASTSTHDLDMPNLEDLTHSDDADNVGAEADINNLESIISTKSMARAVGDQGGISQIFNEDFHTCINKKDERGIVIKNKARLVAQGHTQEEGIDYEEVFSPVARNEAIRLFLAYASFMAFQVYQLDVKSAFLYGTIEEEVYVCQPLGFEDPKNPNKVYKVVKALYGLHQAPRAWYETLATYLLGNGFQRGIIDQTLFIKKQQKDILLVQIYVDDIIFGATNKALCQSFEKLMKDKFQMSSMGELTFFLGLEVKQKKDRIFISQDKYVAEILKKFRLSEGKSASTPIDAEKPLLKDADGEDVDVYTYRVFNSPMLHLLRVKMVINSPWMMSKNWLVQKQMAFEEQVQADDAVAAAVQENVVEDVANDAIPSPPSHDIPSPSQAQYSPPQQPQSSTTRVKRLERANKVKSSKLRRLRKVGASRKIESSDDMEDVFNQGRMIDDLDKYEWIELVKDADIPETEGRHAAEQAKKHAEIHHLDLDHPSKVLSMQEDDSKVQKVVEVVTTAKLITDFVTAASSVSAASATISTVKPSIPAAALTVVAAYTRRRKGVIIRDPEEELSLKTPVETPKLKDKGKEINKDIDWDATIDHVNQKSKNPQYIKRYQVIKKRPQTESEARKNMMIYLKNTAGYKMDFFKSKEEMEEEYQVVLKSINETPAQKAAKRRKLNEEAQEAEDLKKRLEVVDDEDDDVFIEATPLARKVPVVDYQIVLIDNKPRFKIIRADETHQLYINFITLLKNFDRENLENLWEIVKERFSTSKPTNFSDEYLLRTLKTMFEKPDGQDAIWKSQIVHGLASGGLRAIEEDTSLSFPVECNVCIYRCIAFDSSNVVQIACDVEGFGCRAAFSKEEFIDILTLYPIPSKYRVILPKYNQTIFDAPPGFIYLGFVPSSPLMLSSARIMVVSPLLTSLKGSLTCVELINGLLFPNGLEKHIPNLLPKVITRIEGWNECKRPAIMVGGKGIYLSCFFLHFPFSLIHDLLFLLAEMAFKNFIYTEDDEDLSFLPKEPSLDFDTISIYVSVNMEPLKVEKELVIQPAEIKDMKCKSRGGSSRPPIRRKLAPGLPDVLELKDATPCYLKIFSITPLAWKNHLDNHMDVKLLDLNDRCYDSERARAKEYEELLTGRLVSFVILYERCKAYEQVADMKEPFNLSQMKGYHSSYKKGHIQANSDLATTTFLWLDEFVEDPSAPINALLSKKLPSLQRPVSLRTHVPLPFS